MCIGFVQIDHIPVRATTVGVIPFDSSAIGCLKGTQGRYSIHIQDLESMWVHSLDYFGNLSILLPCPFVPALVLSLGYSVSRLPVDQGINERFISWKLHQFQKTRTY